VPDEDPDNNIYFTTP
jgi:vacuolar-type H+-ATPase subunit I/STV1